MKIKEIAEGRLTSEEIYEIVVEHVEKEHLDYKVVNLEFCLEQGGRVHADVRMAKRDRSGKVAE